MTVDPEVVGPWLHPAAERVLLLASLSEDGCFQANCGVSVEPPVKGRLDKGVPAGVLMGASPWNP